MAPPDQSRVVEPELSLSKLKDGTIVEVIPRSEFITSVIIVIIFLAAVPYLSYSLFKFYDNAKPYMERFPQEFPDKNTYENMWIGSIVVVVLLVIAIIIFLSFYFKNYSKRAFTQDNISIKQVFQKISREVAQHAADEYSDQKVDAHMADMETLGGRIMAARNNDKWYDKPEEFQQNYTKIMDDNNNWTGGWRPTGSNIGKYTQPDTAYAKLQSENAALREELEQKKSPDVAPPASVQGAITQTPPVDLLGGSPPATAAPPDATYRTNTETDTRIKGIR